VRRDHDRARYRLEELKGTRRGLVTVGTIECLASDFAPTVFRKIQDRHPGIALTAFIEGTQQIVAALLGGTIDIAVSFTVPSGAGIEHFTEIAVPIGAVMSPEHRLSDRPSLRLSQLPGFPLLLPASDMPIRVAIDEAFASANVAFSPVVMSNSMTLIKNLAKHGERIALISKLDAYAELLTGELVFVPIESRHLKQGPLSISKRQGQLMSPAIKIVADALHQELAHVLSTPR
jgi:DNA-binding transcriptional LysR family regulator